MSLCLPNPWEIARPANAIKVPFYGYVVSWMDEKGKLRNRWETKDYVLALPYDTPIPGYKNNTVNNLRLWSAKSTDDFGLSYFNNGDYIAAVQDMELSETISARPAVQSSRNLQALILWIWKTLLQMSSGCSSDGTLCQKWPLR